MQEKVVQRRHGGEYSQHPDNDRLAEVRPSTIGWRDDDRWILIAGNNIDQIFRGEERSENACSDQLHQADVSLH